MKHFNVIKSLKAFRQLVVDHLWLAHNKEQLISFMRARPALRPAIADVANALWWGMRPVVALALIMAIVFGVSGSIVVAAKDALPTEPLYPIKLTAEKLESLLIFNDAKKINFLVNLAAKRLQELEQKIEEQNGNVEQKVVDASLRSYSSLISEASKNIDKASQGKPQDKAQLLNVVSSIETTKHREILNNIEKSNAPKSEALVDAKEASLAVDALALGVLKEETQSDEELAHRQAMSQLDTLAHEISSIEEQFTKIKSIKGYLPLIEADAKLSHARSLLESGRRSLDGGEYVRAAEFATDGLKEVIEATKMLISLFGLEPIE